MVGTTLYKTLFLLGACACVMRGAIGDDRSDVCSNINPNVDAGSEFTFKNKFQVHVESVLPDLGTIINGPMAFSEKNKMFKATLTAPGYNRALYNDYEYSQTLAYDFLSGGRGSCRVDPTMNERWNLFLIPQPPAEGTEMKTSDALRLTGPSGFGGEQIALERKSVGSKFRSMTVTEYVSCQKIKAANGAEIIAKVTHLFSDAGFAKSETGSVPVQVKIIGRYTSGSDKGKDITQTYNFFHYQTSFGDEVFEAPTGIVCPNRVGPNNFPEQPTHVQFGQEIHYPNDVPKMRTMKTTYDMEFNFVLEQTFNEDPSKRDTFRLDDFYSGLTYSFNPDTGECSSSNITENIKVNDYVEEDGKIRMANPAEFFSTDNIDYHYNGKKHFRGLQTEAWIGKEEKTGRTFEWYFAWGIESSVNDYATITKGKNLRIPYKRLLYPDDSSKVYTTYYYQVDFTAPSLFVDLSGCFNEQKLVSLYVPGLTIDRVQKDETIVLRRALRTLTEALDVRFTRIAGLAIVFQGDKGYFVFQLLEAPKHAPNVRRIGSEVSLEQAYERLKIGIESEKIMFDVGNKDITVISGAKIEDIKIGEPERGSDGYSAGALGGLAFGMAVLGLAGGGAGGYWFLMRQ